MIRLADITRATAEIYGLSKAEIVLNGTRNDVNNYPLHVGSHKAKEARQVAAFLARRLTNRSYPAIARGLGYANHSAVWFGERRIQNHLQNDDDLRTTVVRILAKLVLAAVERPIGQAVATTPAILASLSQPANEAHPQ